MAEDAAPSTATYPRSQLGFLDVIWGFPKPWVFPPIAGWFMDGLFHGKSENQMDDLRLPLF